jgi:hypothetical protein
MSALEPDLYLSTLSLSDLDAVRVCERASLPPRLRRAGGHRHAQQH